MQPNRNTKWILYYSRLLDLVPSNIVRYDDKFTVFVSDSNDAEVTLKAAIENRKKRQELLLIPIKNFFFAVDDQHIPIEHKNETFMKYIKDLQTKGDVTSMFAVYIFLNYILAYFCKNARKPPYW